LSSNSVAAAATIRYVQAGGDLQAEINAAQPGDELWLEAGATFVGPFTLPAKPNPDGSYITIRTSTPDSQLPPGVRIRPADGAKLAKLVAASGSVLQTEVSAGYYRFVGLEMSPSPGAFLYNVVLLGLWPWTETHVDQLPHHFVFERSYIHGDPLVGSRRGIALNGRHVDVLDSYLSDFKEVCCDSQAIAGWNGSGPFLIENNYLEGAGENLIFGGDDPSIPNLVPSDIRIRRNHLAKPLRWNPADPSYEGTNWVVKNLFQLKNARRVRVERNLFEYNWADDQNGFAIVFTPRNSNGNSPWAVVEDIVFKNNQVRHATSGINILGWDNVHSSGQAKRISIRNNLFFDIGGARWGEGSPATYGYGQGGWFLQLLDGTAEIVVEHNTVIQSKGVVVADVAWPNGPHAGELHTGFVFRNNIVRHASLGIAGPRASPGFPTLQAYFFGPVFDRNIFVGGDPQQYPGNNFLPASIDDVGFVKWNYGIFRLARRSPHKNQATDGADIGVRPASRAIRRYGESGPVDIGFPVN
jgi:hypothetical protein